MRALTLVILHMKGPWGTYAEAHPVGLVLLYLRSLESIAFFVVWIDEQMERQPKAGMPSPLTQKPFQVFCEKLIVLPADQKSLHLIQQIICQDHQEACPHTIGSSCWRQWSCPLSWHPLTQHMLIHLVELSETWQRPWINCDRSVSHLSMSLLTHVYLLVQEAHPRREEQSGPLVSWWSQSVSTLFNWWLVGIPCLLNSPFPSCTWWCVPHFSRSVQMFSEDHCTWPPMCTQRIP